jgi:hypothetical protein
MRRRISPRLRTAPATFAAALPKNIATPGDDAKDLVFVGQEDAAATG